MYIFAGIAEHMYISSKQTTNRCNNDVSYITISAIVPCNLSTEILTCDIRTINGRLFTCSYSVLFLLYSIGI